MACPECHRALEGGEELECPKCHRKLLLESDLVTLGATIPSFFDDKFETMQAGNRDEGTWAFCYQQQTDYLKEATKPGSVVLDVGCGPEPVYGAQESWFLIGLDPSLASLKANKALNLKIHTTADKIPLASDSVDVIACFYSVHHMVGERYIDTKRNVIASMREFSRIVRPGGSIIIFDMSPLWPVWVIEKAAWNIVRRLLGSKLDMFFWHWKALSNIADSELKGWLFTTRAFRSRWTETFPPVFNFPRLRMPRLFYPMVPRSYHWIKASR